MPTVPRLNRTATPDALPAVRSTTKPTLEAFGAGASSDALNNAGQKVLGDEITRIQTAEAAEDKERERIYLEEKKKADEIAIQDFDLGLSQAHSDIETQVRNMKGRDALTAGLFAEEEWKKRSEEAIKSLHNQEQRFAAEKIMKARAEMLYRTAQTHTAGEIERFDDGETKAYISTVMSEGINNAMDDERVGLSIFQQKAALQKYGRRKGLFNADGSESDTLKGEIAAAVSDTHVGVIEKRLSLGEIQAARAYYEKNKGEITYKDTVKFPEYIDNYEKRIKAQRDAERTSRYDETLRRNMIDAFSGKLTLTELQRQFRADETDVGDYTKMAHIVADPDFAFMRPDRLTDPAVFNEIRQAQLSGSKSQGELLRMIRDAAADGKLANNALAGGKDVDYLVRLTKETPPSPEDVHLDSQARAVRDFANRYYSDQEGFIAQRFPTEGSKKEKDTKIEAMVSDFIRRVDAEGAKGERVAEIAKEVQAVHIRKDFPEVGRLEDLPHVVIDARGKIRRVLNPDQQTKLKANYKVVPNKVEAAPAKKAEKK